MYKDFYLKKPEIKKAIDSRENFILESADKKKVSIQVLYCYTRETELILGLRSCLITNYKLENQKYYRYIGNSEDNVSNILNFSTIPFYDGFYLYIQKTLIL